MKKIIYTLSIVFSSSFIVYGQTSEQNYVKTTAPQVPVQTSSAVTNLPDDDKTQTITYYDGLGRQKQSITKHAGGQRQDIVVPTIYDEFGRKVQEYLPYANTQQTGSGSLDYRNQTNLITDLHSYYSVKHPSDINAQSPNPYSRSILENSPLSRPLEQGAPGEAWLADPLVDTDHTIKFSYATNGANEVVHYEVVFPTGNTEQPTLQYNGYHDEGTLYKSITKDENWAYDPDPIQNRNNTTEEFKDKQGRVVLKRTYNLGLQFDTYYVYDDYGNLTYVLSPKGSDELLANQNYVKFNQSNKPTDVLPAGTLSSSSGYFAVVLDDSPYELTVDFELTSVNPPSELATGPVVLLDEAVPDMVVGTLSGPGYNYLISVVDNHIHISGSGTVSSLIDNITVTLPTLVPDPTKLDDLCYQYHYDSRNRLVEKKIPGKGWEYIVYNKLNQPIMTQDANLKAINRWLFTKYDALGRVAYTGYGNHTADRIALQGIADSYTTHYEESTTSAQSVGGTSIFYTNNTVPSVDGIYTVNYYDGYNSDLISVATDPGTVYGTATTSNVTSLSTGSLVRVLDTNDWITTVTYYDDKARPIYAASKNTYLGTTDIVETHLDDFNSRVLQTRTSHSKSGQPTIVTFDDFTYDHAGRLLSHSQEIEGGSQERIMVNHYDELGQLVKKDVGGETVFEGYTDLVNVTYNAVTGEITKTTGSNSNWDAGIATKGKFSGDGYVEWTVSQNDKQIMIGLSDINNTVDYDEINFAIVCRDDQTIVVREDTNGDGINDYIGNYGSYAAGDTFKVARENGLIRYYKNNVLFYTSNLTPPTGNLLGDASLRRINAAISNFSVNSSNLNTILQEVDYSYNIRGWLKEINDIANIGSDLFTFKLNYNTTELSSGNPNWVPTPLYNGNISETLWQTTTDDRASVNSRGYFYMYDDLNRLTNAVYRKDGGASQNGHYNINLLTYDKNGNIVNLNRTGYDNNNNYVSTIDKLTYYYDGNQLMDVKEQERHDLGFIDVNATHTGDDYEYDDNGNLTKDNNKNITSIDYNHLNLPKQVSSTNGSIIYIFDATGVKLEKQVNDGGAPTSYTRYAGNYIYKQDGSGEVLQFFNQPEGYIEENNTGVYDYVYQYKDHLGNIRLSYSDSNKDGAITTNEIREENNYYPFGLKHKGYNNVINGTVNHYKDFQGQELHEELDLNWYSFKYRFYNPALARFHNIDPLAQEYAYQSPYNFSENRVIDGIELEGAERLSVHTPNPVSPKPMVRNNHPTKLQINAATAIVVARHPVASKNVGAVEKGGTNISSVSGRIARHAAENGNMTVGDGSERNALRHATWIATITSKYGEGAANNIGNAHEGVEIGATANVDFSQPAPDNLLGADSVVDFLNNEIGREIGAQLGEGATEWDAAVKSLEVQLNEGLWTATEDANGNITIARTKITQEQYNTAMKVLKTLNVNGMNSEDRKTLEQDKN